MTLENGGAGVVPVMDMNHGYGDGMGFGGGWWLCYADSRFAELLRN